MLEGATPNGVLPPWEPDELGLTRASVAGVLLVAGIAVVAWFGASHLPKRRVPIAPTTTVHLVTLAKPPPLPMPPPVVQPPPPQPPPPQPIPKPPPPIPAPSPIPPPKPAPRPVIHHPPPPPVRRPVHKPRPVVHPRPNPIPKPQPKPPPPQPAFNFRSYAAALRGPLQREVPISQAIRMLGLHGTAYIEFTLAPSGHLVSAKIYHSSGNALIDKAALDTVLHHHFPPFPGSQDKTFALPIEIEVHQ